jgi:XTP/dITP diphosphohydrolase
MVSIIATTTNRHKFHEIAAILNLPKVRLLSLLDLGHHISAMDVEETGNTFEENAAIKAREYFRVIRRPLFADDSGLEVPALNNEPGVYSARYAGPGANYADNNRLLIQKIRDIPDSERGARFVCTICYKDEEQEAFFTGITEGLITDHLRGEQGFGYDPLFHVPGLGKTFAELTTEEKNALSHRGKAVRKLRSFLIEKFEIE